MISTEEVDKAFHYLNDTIEEYARAQSYHSGLIKQERTILAEALIMSSEKTLGMKEAFSRVSKPYKEWQIAYEDSVYELETIKAKRLLANMTWERWRSEFSAMKQGVAL